jgi:UDP-N-acetylglucosamine 2-epimerase (non-hydrolysing)
MNRIVSVVGARPNFVKMMPVIDALEAAGGVEQLVVHTGQHYDRSMSGNVLDDLGFPTPDVHLEIGSGTHAEQTGRTMMAFERVVAEHRPEMVVVAGDVSATLACALASVKLGVPVAHVESGLRSGDWSMPEEINRLLTDRISTLLFTHSPEAAVNLLAEGVPAERVHYVGNSMIDSLQRLLPEALARAVWRRAGCERHGYVLVTLHRPSNVDDRRQLERIVESLVRLAEQAIPIVFPIHPRTRSALEELGCLERLVGVGVRCWEPLGYVDFLSLEAGAGAIVTDSGGIQEESTALGVRCYTLRSTTERPITITLGTNVLLGDSPAAILQVRPSGRPPVPRSIPLWDGSAGRRVAQVLTAAVGLGATEFDIGTSSVA